MMKTYISALLIALLAAAQMTHAQGNMDGVFAQLDAANEAEPASTVAESAGQAPAAVESDTLSWLFEKGRAQYKAGNYNEAIVMFDGMLAIDKYNADAVAHKKRAAKRIASREAGKKDTSRAQALADIDSAWNPEPKVFDAVVESGAAVAADPDQRAIEQVVARLKAITIPTLDFSDAGIEEVVRFFAETSRNQGGEDVDILLVGMESAMGNNNVTISVADMSLYEALQYVVEMATLKFEIKPNLVVIMPANYVPAAAMVAKSYDIIPEVGVDLESVADSGGGAEDLFGDAPSEAETGPVDVAAFFSIVDFPEGSSAVYQPRFKKLFVKNTPKSLKAIEAVLTGLEEEAIKMRSQQVEIEAKFIEFSEGALEELGFDWNVYGSGTAAGMELDPRGIGAVGGAPDPNTGQTILADGLAGDGRPGQNLFGSAQRDNTEGFETIQSGLFGLMGGTPATMMFGNGDIDIQISAMEQEGVADVLSAPKVTTKSGAEAVIRIAETHRYPQDYDVETGQKTSPVVKPQDWEDVDLGVSLKVIPVVDSESGTIDLDLHPQILRLKNPDFYVVGVAAFIGGLKLEEGVWVIDVVGDGADLIAIMPSFDRRSVQTQVTVADGHTVALGGLVDERTETFRDSVPFLGDIPYLGRLFRTEGSRSAKKNLAIFVKATMVDPSGMSRADRLAHQ
ncbi:MAG: hypothetical protein ABFR33_08775 [Verrucomicrobiota bacterium]